MKTFSYTSNFHVKTKKGKCAAKINSSHDYRAKAFQELPCQLSALKSTKSNSESSKGMGRKTSHSPSARQSYFFLSVLSEVRSEVSFKLFYNHLIKPTADIYPGFRQTQKMKSEHPGFHPHLSRLSQRLQTLYYGQSTSIGCC